MAAPSLRRLGYRRARVLILVAGLVVLSIIAAVTFARRVEPVEVIATLLFIPVFVALVFWGPWGGAIAGIVAAGVYTALRLPAIDAVGLEPFLGVIVSRAAGLILFGAVGGWALQQVERSIRKLEEHDRVDDETGLLNARAFLLDTDLEMARSTRYQTIFSVCAVEFRALDGGSRRGRRALRDVARDLRDSARTVDRVAHARDEGRHVIVAILPETGPEGAEVFSTRFADLARRRLGDVDARARTWTFPQDEAELRAFRDELRPLVEREYPDAGS